MLDAGLTVIVALVSPFGADRAAARNLFAPGDFVEVWVDTPLAVCARRDPKACTPGRTPALVIHDGCRAELRAPGGGRGGGGRDGPPDQAVARLVAAVTG